MVLQKTVRTLFTKPFILVMAAAIYLLPYVLGAALGSVEGIYDGAVMLFTILMTILFIGPMAMYTYEVCDDSIEHGWFRRGFLKNTVKILIAVVLARVVIAILSRGGIMSTRMSGSSMYLFSLFGVVIATAFEAVAKISISSTNDFSEALDKAIGVTKSIYLKVAVVVLAFSILQGALVFAFEANDTSEEYVYIENLGDVPVSMLTDEQVEKYVQPQDNQENLRKIQTQDMLLGLFNTLSSAFILIYCAHHFVEDKRLTDSAYDRLNFSKKNGY